MNAARQIRVLHVIDSFDLGGAQTALLNLVRAMDRTRFSAEIACMHGRGVFWENFSALGVPVHSLSPAKWLPLYVPRLMQLIIQRRFDVVHCHLFGANWIAKPVAAAMRVPVLVNHDQCNDRLRHDSSGARWIDTATNRLSSHVCAVSRSTRDFLIEQEHLPGSRVSVVYNGVDTAHFTPAPRIAPPEAGALIAGVGRLHPQKDFTLFLDVAAALAKQHSTVHFLIAGTGPEDAALRDHAAALGIADRVTFAGHVSDMREVYGKADLLLMTSRYEGTPLTVLEAMASGVPVVASRLDGIAEVITDGADGFLITPGLRDEFVRRVSAVLADAELRGRVAQAARETVVANFSAKAMTAQVEAIYTECLAAR